MPRKKTSRKQRGGRNSNTKNRNKTQKKQYGGNNTLLQKIETSIKEDDIDLFRRFIDSRDKSKCSFIKWGNNIKYNH